MIFGNKILTDEIERLRKDNERKDAMLLEIIDRFVHNRAPERLAQPSVKAEVEAVSDGMGDPVSLAERAAWEESKPKTPAYLNGRSEPLSAPTDD